ncbi:SGNH/GDSL hydrolase family protein [Streptomyces sp. NPDC051776]|uniref:SGNH/GDSL hydrolase family protein n=1 Tax=Streptomyces sp. NPDC051776 TaxID=3155414 RepID=UPI0034168199
MLAIRRWITGIVAVGAAVAVAAGGAPTPAVAQESRKEPLPLERLFDNAAVSDDARPAEADFDGTGQSLSAQDLRAAGWTPGRTLVLDGARLTWPRSAAGLPDNVRANGQAVRLRGRGDAVSFIVAGTGAGADVSGTGTVRYRDGGRASYTLAAPDWRTGPLATKAVALPHINTPDGQRAEKVRLYAVTVPVDRGREIASVVLPRDPGHTADLHVFAAAVRSPAQGWTGTWSASTSGYAAVGPWADRSVRLVVHTSAGGRGIRVRLANTFASAPVRIGHASVAVQASGAAAAGPPQRLSFGGRQEAVIPAGAEVFSDPVVRFRVPADTNLLVSLHLPDPVTAAPLHSRTNQLSYVSAQGSGDRTADTGGEAYSGTISTWPFLTGVDTGGGPGSVVALGDSITDGDKSTLGANRRWPDVLARRFQAQSAVPRYGVLNQGISANRIVTDRYPGDGVSMDTGGVSAQHRLDRDVLAQTHARTVVVFEGINDIRWGATPEQIVAGLRAVAERSKARGLRMVAATIAPCEGYPDCTPDVDARRTAVNAFIRENTGTFDAVLDFDAVIRDPSRPQRMLPAYDSGDHLHPGDAGLKALADSIDLRLLVP